MMKKALDEEDKMEDEGYKCMPLLIEVLDKKLCVGVLAIKGSLSVSKEDENLMLEIVAGYVAIVVYNAVVIVEKKHRDIENAQDDFRRAKHEENLLHVQNMVLDNCLSTIKHETIYYPNKIKQIVSQLLTDNPKSLVDNKEELDSVGELITYYRGIFSILYSCAARQLEDVTFRRSEIVVADLFHYAQNYFKKKNTNTDAISFDILENDFRISGDIVLMQFMLENLINESLKDEKAGRILLKAQEMDDFIRFDFIDTRHTYSVEELNKMFYPQMDKIEYLICRQIIREHDEFAIHRGCRINAEPAVEGGFTIYFTLTKNVTRYGR